VFLPAAGLPRACSRTATVAPLLDVAQTLIDDLGSDAQRLQLSDAVGLLLQSLQRLLRRIVVRVDSRQHGAARAGADHRLRRGAAAHAVAAQGQRRRRPILSLLNTMLAFAHRHARQRNALALLESGMQLLFFTYRRDNNAPLFGPSARRAAAARDRVADFP
jgi:hypothetical protein